MHTHTHTHIFGMQLNKEQEQSLEHDSVMQGHNIHVSGLLPLLIHSNFICV
jgi:hypothetical protein